MLPASPQLEPPQTADWFAERERIIRKQILSAQLALASFFVALVLALFLLAARIAGRPPLAPLAFTAPLAITTLVVATTIATLVLLTAISCFVIFTRRRMQRGKQLEEVARLRLVHPTQSTLFAGEFIAGFVVRRYDHTEIVLEVQGGIGNQRLYRHALFAGSVLGMLLFAGGVGIQTSFAGVLRFWMLPVASVIKFVIILIPKSVRITASRPQRLFTIERIGPFTRSSAEVREAHTISHLTADPTMTLVCIDPTQSLPLAQLSLPSHTKSPKAAIERERMATLARAFAEILQVQVRESQGRDSQPGPSQMRG